MSTATAVGRAPHTGTPGVLELLPAREYPRPVTVDARVLANRHLSDRYWQLSLAVPHIAGSFEPGQFVMITVTRSVSEGPVLPRPMAIYDADRATGRIEIVYSVVGVGTRALTTFGVGDTVGVVGPLGRGFHPPAGDVLLLGRGIGICSLTPLAALANDDAVVTAVASGRHPGAILGREVYQAHGVRLLAVHDADGSSAPDRLATRLQDLLDTAPPALIAACGSARLEALALRLAARWGSDVQVALEAHMACGLGYCHGCSTGDRSAAAEAPLICRDGPVFRLRTSPAQPAPCLNS